MEAQVVQKEKEIFLFLRLRQVTFTFAFIALASVSPLAYVVNVNTFLVFTKLGIKLSVYSKPCSVQVFVQKKCKVDKIKLIRRGNIIFRCYVHSERNSIEIMWTSCFQLIQNPFSAVFLVLENELLCLSVYAAFIFIFENKIYIVVSVRISLLHIIAFCQLW